MKEREDETPVIISRKRRFPAHLARQQTTGQGHTGQNAHLHLLSQMEE